MNQLSPDMNVMPRARRLTTRALLTWTLIAINAVVLGVFLVFADDFSDITGALLLASFVVVGGVLVLKLPNNSVAWLLLVIATGWSSTFILPFEGGWVIPLGLMSTQLLLRFPSGSLPSQRWKWFSVATIVLIAALTFTVSVGDPRLEETNEVNPYYIAWAKVFFPLILLQPVFMIVSAVSLIVRYRRAGMVEREQIRWLAWAAGTVTAIYTVTLLLSINSPWASDTSTPIGLLQALSLASFALVPLSIGVAVLKYRLYEIDRLISRTTSYTIVTGLVLGTFGAVIALGSRLLPASSTLTVATATLTAVAAFRPLLKRVQAIVDKRFNRERYNAALTLDAFGERLRDVVDTETVADSLMAAVGVTLAPSHATLWLRDTGRQEETAPRTL